MRICRQLYHPNSSVSLLNNVKCFRLSTAQKKMLILMKPCERLRDKRNILAYDGLDVPKLKLLGIISYCRN